MNANLLADAVRLAKAMAHPTRLRILALLHHGPLPVCHITCILHGVESTVSGHLLDLRHSGVAAEQRKGKFVYYRLSDAAEKDAVLDAMIASLSEDPQVRQDVAMGASIRAVSPLITCDELSCDFTRGPNRHPWRPPNRRPW